MTHAAPITGHLCIGGPLDGKIWPGDVPPTLPLAPPMEKPRVVNEEPRNATVRIEYVRYVPRTMRPPVGEAVTLFCDDRLTVDQLRDVMNERYPRGLI